MTGERAAKLHAKLIHCSCDDDRDPVRFCSFHQGYEDGWDAAMSDNGEQDDEGQDHG